MQNSLGLAFRDNPRKVSLAIMTSVMKVKQKYNGRKRFMYPVEVFKLN